MREGLSCASTAFSRSARLSPRSRALRFRLFALLGILQLYPSGSLLFSPHQAAEEEYRLIGMAIKFAGICGKEVRVHGRNRETVDQSQTTH